MIKLFLKTMMTGMVALIPLASMADVGGSLTRGPDGRFAVMSGSSLRDPLEGWARSSGWTLIWDQDSDYLIRSSAVFNGDFETAVIDLVDSIHLDNPELSVVLYRGNAVVHIENRYSSGD
jgi:hypothetical protein